MRPKVESGATVTVEPVELAELEVGDVVLCRVKGNVYLHLVKALRGGEGNIAESYAEVKGNQVFLVNSNIPEYSHGNRENHEPKRPRKLLLHEREIEKMHSAVSRKGMTLVPLMVYFNSQGRAKIELALAKGKQTHDKRETIKDRDWKRDQQRIMRDKG